MQHRLAAVVSSLSYSRRSSGRRQLCTLSSAQPLVLLVMRVLKSFIDSVANTTLILRQTYTRTVIYQSLLLYLLYLIFEFV